MTERQTKSCCVQDLLSHCNLNPTCKSVDILKCTNEALRGFIAVLCVYLDTHGDTDNGEMLKVSSEMFPIIKPCFLTLER